MKKTALGIMLTLLLIGMLTLVFKIQPARASGTIYIKADGSVDPPTAPIFTLDNATYTFTGNIHDEIVVEKDNIVVNGAGYSLEGTGSGNGFYWFDVKNVTINNTNIKGFTYSIYLESASHNVISGNNITANNYDGIGLYESSNNNISQNNITANNWFGIGLYYSSDNNISQNNITANNYDGIWLIESSDNNISRNNITDNYDGIGLYYSSNNSIFHNNFVNNTHQVYTEFSVNVWDDDYPSGGNYWSDHTGIDNYRSPNQNDPGSDGICDTAYTIDANNQDNYPLTKPYGGPYDIGITNVTTSKTVVGQGYILNISIKTINYGINTETFSITAYVNTTKISQTQVTLTTRNSTTVTFTWNTTGFDKGNYTVSAYVTQVEGETYVDDNSFIDGWVFVTIVGDVNGDRKVNVFDGVITMNAVPSVPGWPNWNPNADINCDGKVNVFDAVLCIGNIPSGPW